MEGDKSRWALQAELQFDFKDEMKPEKVPEKCLEIVLNDKQGQARDI